MTDQHQPLEVPLPEAGSRLPRWVVWAVGVFWLGYLIMLAVGSVLNSLSTLLLLLVMALFLSFAIEPAVNRLARRGWRRGTATALILISLLVLVIVFLSAEGTLVGGQIADLLGNLDRYVTRTVKFINDTFGTNLNPTKVLAKINDPNGPVQRYIKNQGSKALEISIAVVGFLVETLSVLFFTFYLVADGPKLRRALCSRLEPHRQHTVLNTWNLAIDKTGGFLYSRALLAGISGVYYWILFQSVGTAAPVALALWVGLVSQFLPVIGTYIAAALPLIVTVIDSPVKALVLLIAITLWKQFEDYVLAPRITARTMELHPAIAFGSALAGVALLGVVGAILALPAAAMAQAIIGASGKRFDVVDTHLTTVPHSTSVKSRRHPSRRPRTPIIISPHTAPAEPPTPSEPTEPTA